MQKITRLFWGLVAVIPTALGEMLHDEDDEKSQRVMQAMLQMNKIDIQGLQKAYARQ